MSSPAEQLAGPGPLTRHHDDGFTLIEVLVCIVLIGVVATAVLPQLISGITSNDIARVRSQAKVVAQGQTEQLRNLPYYVAPAVTPMGRPYLDLLDRYYRDRVAPTAAVSCGATQAPTVPGAGWTGYVSSGACAWEPPAPFYRHVDTTTYAGFVVVTDSRFLSDATPPAAVAPPADYDSQVEARSLPPAAQIGVTVGVFSRGRSIGRPVVSTTQIGRSGSSTDQSAATIDVTAVELGTIVAVPTASGSANVPLRAVGGQVRLASSLTSVSAVNADLSAAQSSLGTGAQQSGATASVQGPPASAGNSATASEGQLDADGCARACWGPTTAVRTAVSVTDALPSAGGPTTPMQARIDGGYPTSTEGEAGESGASANVALGLAQGAGTSYRPGLDLRTDRPLAFVDNRYGVGSGTASDCTVTGAGSTRAMGSAWLLATSAPRVEACGTARSTWVGILPTSQARRGVLQVRVPASSALCRVEGPTHVASAGYAYYGEVRYWTGPGAADYSSPITITGSRTSPLTTDPLASLNLATIAVGPRKLGDYIASISAATASSVTASATAGKAEVTVPSVLSVLTRPVRPGPSPLSSPVSGGLTDTVDATSSVSISVGRIACTARDLR